MPRNFEQAFNATEFRSELDNHDHGFGQMPGWMFEGLLLFIDQPKRGSSDGTLSAKQKTFDGLDLRMKQACNTARFAGATFTQILADEGITHVLARTDKASKVLRETLSRYVALSTFNFWRVVADERNGQTEALAAHRHSRLD